MTTAVLNEQTQNKGGVGTGSASAPAETIAGALAVAESSRQGEDKQPFSVFSLKISQLTTILPRTYPHEATAVVAVGHWSGA